jgi:hypothetical protein
MAAIWKSEITVEMVKNISEENLEQLIEELNDAVQEIASSYGVGN